MRVEQVILPDKSTKKKETTVNEAFWACPEPRGSIRSHEMNSARALFLVAFSGLIFQLPAAAAAATCASGVYRAGCAGPNGAVVVRKPGYYPPPVYHAPVPYHPPGSVTCANGPYRAGCAGPNGAAVVHKAY